MNTARSPGVSGELDRFLHKLWGRDGGPEVSFLAFYSDDSSSNHADAYSYFHRREKNIIKQETKYNG